LWITHWKAIIVCHFLILFSVFYDIISISADRVAPELRNALTVSAVFVIKAFYSRKAGVIFMQEIWKDIQGFNGKYQVSNKGHVKSFIKSTKHHNENHLLKPNINNSGYACVALYYEKGKKKQVLVHVLVASAFLLNPNNYPCVNHKDENKLNNCVDNLEWCTYSYNNAYGTARIRRINTISKRVGQFTINDEWLATYRSATVASEILGISSTSIADCCNGKRSYAHGYKWKFVNP
jgi:hypothetical protein